MAEGILGTRRLGTRGSRDPLRLLNRQQLIVLTRRKRFGLRRSGPLLTVERILVDEVLCELGARTLVQPPPQLDRYRGHLPHYCRCRADDLGSAPGGDQNLYSANQ